MSVCVASSTQQYREEDLRKKFEVGTTGGAKLDKGRFSHEKRPFCLLFMLLHPLPVGGQKISQQCLAHSSTCITNEQIFCVLLCAALAIGLTIVSETTIAIRMLNFKNSIGPIKVSLIIFMGITPFDN